MSFMDLPPKAVLEREITTPGTPTQVALSATYAQVIGSVVNLTDGGEAIVTGVA